MAPSVLSCDDGDGVNAYGRTWAFTAVPALARCKKEPLASIASAYTHGINIKYYFYVFVLSSLVPLKCLQGGSEERRRGT